MQQPKLEKKKKLLYSCEICVVGIALKKCLMDTDGRKNPAQHRETAEPTKLALVDDFQDFPITAGFNGLTTAISENSRKRSSLKSHWPGCHRFHRDVIFPKTNVLKCVKELVSPPATWCTLLVCNAGTPPSTGNRWFRCQTATKKTCSELKEIKDLLQRGCGAVAKLRVKLQRHGGEGKWQRSSRWPHPQRTH